MTLNELLEQQRQIAALERQAQTLTQQIEAWEQESAAAAQSVAAARAEESAAQAALDRALRAQAEFDAAGGDAILLGEERALLARQIEELERRIVEIEALGRAPRTRVDRDLARLRAESAALQKRVDELDRKLAEIDALRTRLARELMLLKELRARLEEARYLRERLEAEAQALQTRMARATAELRSTRSALATLTSTHTANLTSLLDQLVPGVPLVLLPVRLETRFTRQNSELLVRVYPDDVHQDTHEPELTEQEETWGQDFWNRVWAAGPGRSQELDHTRLALWQVLAGKFGTVRASYIVSALRPVNLDRWRNDPAERIQLSSSPGQRTGTWTRAAQARCLPDRWLVLGYVSGQRVIEQWGGLIETPLHTGPEPAAAQLQPDQVDAGMRWMVDFNEAERVGMGIRVALPTRARAGLDRLLVIGARATRTPTESVADLMQLLTAHQYTWTLDLVGQGTPTNNTESARTGFESRDRDHEQTYCGTVAPLIEGTQSALGGERDVDLLAQALGMPGDAFAGLRHQNLRDQNDAALMQHVLWPATWGYYLREGFGGVLRERNIDLDTWRQFYTRYVRASGPLPAIRVGRQPYGILPVTSLDLWQPTEPEPEIILLYTTSGARELLYAIGWDLQTDGTLAGGWTEARPVPYGPGAGTVALGAALARFPDQSFPDLFVLVASSTGSARVMAVRTLSPGGTFTGGFGRTHPVPDLTGQTVLATSLHVAPLFDALKRDLIVVRLVANAGRTSTELLLTIGRNIDRDGRPLDGWTKVLSVPGIWDMSVIDVAVAADDIDGDGRVEIVIAALIDTGNGNEVRVLSGSDAQRNATPIWSSATAIQFPEVVFSRCRGLDLAFYRAGANTTVNALLTIVTDDGTNRTAWTWRKQRFSRTGLQQNWQRTGPTYALPPGAGSVGVAGWDLGRRSAISVQGSEVALVNLLSNLRAVWRAAIPNLPSYAARTSTGGTVDPDKNLLESLALTPLASELATRTAIGPAYLEQLYQLFQSALPSGFIDATRASLDGVLSALGLDELLQTYPDDAPRWNTIRYVSEPLEIHEPWVQNGATPDHQLATPLPGNLDYLRWLAAASPAEIHDQNLPAGVDASVLFRLLRHALLQEYSDAARQREFGSLYPERFYREPEIVDPPEIVENMLLEARFKTRTAWRILSDPTANQSEPAGTTIQRELTTGRANDLNRLARTVKALDALSERSVGALERLTKETLDLSSHRLDAWITAVATRRLLQGREQGFTGIHVGGFGWVEKLVPRNTANLSNGFMHAPSLNHAVTAAILRAGHETHRGDGTADQLSIDLSSRRVRAALRLLSGVSEGQSLGAMLGYDFERSLHEAFPGLELDHYIDTFRQKYPLVAGKLTPLAATDATLAADQLGARNVVDGLALVTRFQQGKASGQWDATTIDWALMLQLQSAPPAGYPGLYPELGTTRQVEIEYNALVTTITRLEDTLDAVADLLISESVFQHVQGNFLRAGASLDALSRGEAPPTEFDVLRTPRTGQAVTHIVALTIGVGEKIDQTALWRWLSEKQLNRGASPRAWAEPRLNHWLAQVLPDPARVMCQIEYQRADGTPLDQNPQIVRLSDLQVAPLDALAWLTDGSVADAGELELRILHADAERRFFALDTEDRRQIQFLRTKKFTPDDLSFPEFLELTRVIRTLLASARPLQGEDLRELGLPADNIDLEELRTRAQTSAEDFQAAAARLDRDSERLKPGEIVELLVTLAGYGVSGAFPMGGSEQVDALRDQFRSVTLRVHATNQKLQHLLDNQPGRNASIADQVAYYTAQLKLLFGESFVVLPVLSAGAGTVQEAFETRDRARDASRDELEAWLHRAAQVRPTLHAFANVMLFAEAIGSEDSLNLRVAQSKPADASDDVWVGATAPDRSGSRFAGRTDFVVHVASESSNDAICGLQLDRWVEIIPAPVETTGVAFHCDAPQATAPQSILLAVPPNPRKAWDVAALEAVLLETLELAKVRMVDSERRPALGHFLPALLFARNPGDALRGDTIATNYDLSSAV